MRVRLVGVVALMALVLASCGGGTPEAAGPSEGIQVHGDWTIAINNEDETLARSVEFGNDLTDGGFVLGKLLSGAVEHGAGNAPSLSTWAIYFGEGTAATGSDPCDDPMIFSANPDFTVGCGVPDEQVQLTRDNSSGAITLEGSVQVTSDGVINWVETIAGGTGGETTIWAGSFTGTAVADEPVSAGQSVQVQVDISFTTG